ncbi:MAG: hypothetical protein FE78DRAFT_77889 [Acidomyces sp. 'richmondensis']|nr:MAG: hypothetical protein FE78DRAFT_77889 [Acidomyces sp. 'richmondensis']
MTQSDLFANPTRARSQFVYVNFDAYGADGLTIRVGVPLRARLTLLSAWTVSEAAFNWKFAVPTGALPVPSITGSPPTNNEDLDSRSIMGRIAKFFFSVARRRERRDESSQQQTPTEIELSPLTRLYRSPTSKGSREDYWLTITLSPVTPTKTTLHCALYQHAHSNHTVPTSTQPSVPIQNIQTSLSDSIHALESRFATQGPTGEISTSIAPSQEALLAETRAHARLEGWMGGEVHPASRWRETSSGGRVAEELCRELEGGGCMAADGKELAW